MTVSYKDHSSLSFGLITPPSEMRTAELGPHDPGMDSYNILAPASGSRYNLRKQSQTSLYPGVAPSAYPNNYNPYHHGRRRSGSSSTTATSSTASTSTYRPPSPSFDIDSRVFNVGEFTATVHHFLISPDVRWPAFFGLSLGTSSSSWSLMATRLASHSLLPTTPCHHASLLIFAHKS